MVNSYGVTLSQIFRILTAFRDAKLLNAFKENTHSQMMCKYWKRSNRVGRVYFSLCSRHAHDYAKNGKFIQLNDEKIVDNSLRRSELSSSAHFISINNGMKVQKKLPNRYQMKLNTTGVEI